MATKKELDLFIEKRNLYIDQLDEKEITKEEFLNLNFLLLDQLSMTPFLTISTYEQGLYNYHYYNTLAKYYNTRRNQIHSRNKKDRSYKELTNKCMNYYREKDRALGEILRIKNYKGVIAYYVKVFSTRLQRERLFEIYLEDEEKAIFHTFDKKILEGLKNHHCFLEEERISLIDNYVNNK